MSPSVVKTEPGFTLQTIKAPANQKYNFGAVVDGLDLDTISDEEVKALSEAIWTHKVVIVKGQQHIHPAKQWELVTRLDPDAPQEVHSHGDIKSFKKVAGVLVRGREVTNIPGVENVLVLGNGYQGKDHYGIKDFTIERKPLHDWHAVKLPDEDFEKGQTRFQRWHLDAPLYNRDPAWFTTLRCVKRPKSPTVTVRWDDGSGQTMEVSPGLTAFFSNVQMYEMMTAEEKAYADHSWVEYAPHPYLWMGDSKSNPNGLGIWGDELKGTALEDLPPYEDSMIKRYPMVWINPVTNERAFMVHGICVRKMFLRKSEDEEPEVLTDRVRMRDWLKPIQERVLKPEYILVPEMEEGDMAIWANYQVFHSAIDYPSHMGPRTMHQANIGASKGPTGLFEVPATA